MLKTLGIIAVGYIALVAVMFLSQRTLLYQPTRHEPLDNEALVSQGISFWPDRKDYRAFLIENTARDQTVPEATIIIFHGNAASAIDRLYYRDALTFTHANIMLVEYPGYGQRPGSPSESVIVSEAQALVNAVARERPSHKLFLIGESLGAGVAAAAVSDTNTAELVDGLMLITPWDSLAEVASRHYWFLPVKWLLRERYDSVNNAAGYTGPKVIVLASDDTIIPVSHGQSLFDALQEPKRRVLLEGAGHNNWFSHVDGSWWRDIWRFMNHQAQ